MSNPYDSVMTMEDERRRRQGGDALMDPWADVPGVPAEPEILTDEIEVTPRTQEQVNAGMAELLRRIRERDDPQQASRDYAAELAGGAGVRQALAPAMAPPMPPALPAAPPTMPAAPPAMQSPSLPPPVPQGAPLASTTPPIGAAPPMPAQALGAHPVAATPPAMPPPAMTTPRGQVPPQAPPQDGTAGSEAQALAAPRPPGAQMPPPQTRPADAMAKSMGAPSSSGVQARMGSGPGLVEQGPSFDERLDTARAEDARRERIRSLILGIGALLASGTGNMGLMLPAAIGAGMARRPDEEETLRAGDTREQALGTEQARQRAVLDQLAQRREAQAAEERNQRETLALRAQELQGTQADREIRTGLEVARTDPTSGRSEQMREALVRFARTLPPEVQQSVLAGDLSGLSAEESERLILSLSGVESGRQRGGGGGSSDADGLNPGQRLSGVNVAPEAFVLSVQQASPSMSAEDAQQAADIQWAAMPERMRSHWSSSAEGSRMSTALGQRVPGYEREGLEALAPEQFREARETAIQIAQLEESVGTAIEAVDEIATLGTGEEIVTRGADIVGAEIHPAVSAYNNARADIMGTLADMRRTGVINESEYHRFVRDMPDVSNPRQALSGSRRLQAVLASARQAAAIRMRGLGYRRAEGDSAPTQGASTPQQAPAAPMRMRSPDGRVLEVPPAAQAGARRAGWVPAEGGS